MTISSTEVAFRLDFKPGDPCYYTPENLKVAVAAGYDGADIWGLFTEPQPNCCQKVEVYYGRFWVQPKYAKGFDLTDFTPLYRGPILSSAPLDESVAYIFPSLVEDRLRQERPELFA